MSLEDYPHINDARKAEIAAMTDAELRIEIERGPQGRLPKCVPYMKALLADRQDKHEVARFQKSDSHSQSMLEEAREANATSKAANRYALLAVVVSVTALLVSLLK